MQAAISSTSSTQDLWYRNKLVWLVIAIPALTVAGCALTIFLALTNPHQVIIDDVLELPSKAVAGQE